MSVNRGFFSDVNRQKSNWLDESLGFSDVLAFDFGIP